MLTDAELDSMREQSAALLPDTCEIQRLTSSADSWGGQSQAWAVVASGVPCRVSVATATAGVETELAERVTTVMWHLVTLPHGTDVSLADRIAVAGKVLEVNAIDISRSWSVAIRVTASEVS